jgi:hypothetical protein
VKLSLSSVISTAAIEPGASLALYFWGIEATAKHWSSMNRFTLDLCIAA